MLPSWIGPLRRKSDRRNRLVSAKRFWYRAPDRDMSCFARAIELTFKLSDGWEAMPPDAVARSVAHLPQRKIWQRYAFPFNPVKLSLFALAYLVAYGYGTLFLQTAAAPLWRSEEHTSELQSRRDLVCRLL